MSFVTRRCDANVTATSTRSRPSTARVVRSSMNGFVTVSKRFTSAGSQWNL